MLSVAYFRAKHTCNAKFKLGIAYETYMPIKHKCKGSHGAMRNANVVRAVLQSVYVYMLVY